MGRPPNLCYFFCFAVFAAYLPRAAVAQLLVDQWSDSTAAIEQEFPVRYTLRHEIGSGIGYGEGFTRLEMLTPIVEPGGVSLLFADLQLFVDNSGSFGSNAGLGFRYYNAALDRVFGVYGYFDCRDTDHYILSADRIRRYQSRIPQRCEMAPSSIRFGGDIQLQLARFGAVSSKRPCLANQVGLTGLARQSHAVAKPCGPLDAGNQTGLRLRFTNILQAPDTDLTIQTAGSG
jgi:hypothetical protein